MRRLYRCYRWNDTDWEDRELTDAEAAALRRDGWYVIPL